MIYPPLQNFFSFIKNEKKNYSEAPVLTIRTTRVASTINPVSYRGPFVENHVGKGEERVSA